MRPYVHSVNNEEFDCGTKSRKINRPQPVTRRTERSEGGVCPQRVHRRGIPQAGLALGDGARLRAPRGLGGRRGEQNSRVLSADDDSPAPFL